MAKAASKATALTTLQIGSVEVPVGLFSTRDKPGRLVEFTTAGPNGGVLKAQAVARPVPVIEAPAETVERPVHSDPLGDELIVEPKTETLPADLVERQRQLYESVITEHWSEERATAAEAAAAGDPVAISAGELAGAGGNVPADGDPSLVPADFDDPKIPMSFGKTRAEWEADPTPIEPGFPKADQVDGEYGRQLVEEDTGLVVEPQNVRRGVRLKDGRFIDCTGQLAEIAERTKLDRMEVIGFVDITQVPRARVQGAYYVGAGDEKAPRALRIIFEGLRRSRRGAIVKLTKKTRQSLGVLGWLGGSLVLYELGWSEDFRPAPARAARIQKASVSETEVATFCQLIDAMSVPVSALDELRDDALALREELHARALAGEVPEVLTPAPVAEAQDVLAQLEASLAAVA